MNERELQETPYRVKLLECARTAAACNYALYRPGVQPDLGYLDNASDERLRTIVRSWFRTADVDSLLAERQFFVA